MHANRALPEITDEYMTEMRQKSATYTMVVLKQGPTYHDPEASSIIWEHGRRNFALRANGVLAVVCPVLDDTDTCGFGIFAASEEDTASIMEGDPGVAAGVFTYELHPVRSFPGDALPSPG